MDSPIWVNVQEKVAYVLGLRGSEVYRLRIRGLMLKSKARGIVEKLQQGADPREVGGKLELIDTRSIARASVSPGNNSLKLHRPDGTSLAYSTAGSDADAILAEILSRSDRTFKPAQEDVSLLEAILPPTVTGAIAGVLWLLVFDVARKHAEGQEVEVTGRRQGMKKLMIFIADTLGYGGTIAVGALLAAAVVAWLVVRIVKRPVRTAWLPD